MAGDIFCFFITSMHFMSGRPALTSVASWRVKPMRSLGFTRPIRNFGILMLICLLPRPPPFAADFAPLAAFGSFLAAAGAAAPFTSPIALGKSPLARIA